MLNFVVFLILVQGGQPFHELDHLCYLTLSSKQVSSIILHYPSFCQHKVTFNVGLIYFQINGHGLLLYLRLQFSILNNFVGLSCFKLLKLDAAGKVKGHKSKDISEKCKIPHFYFPLLPLLPQFIYYLKQINC